MTPSARSAKPRCVLRARSGSRTTSSVLISGRDSAPFVPARPLEFSALISRSRERLNEYIEAGVDHFILAANPHLEEAYRVGEEVLPLVRKGGARAGGSRVSIQRSILMRKAVDPDFGVARKISVSSVSIRSPGQ